MPGTGFWCFTELDGVFRNEFYSTINPLPGGVDHEPQLQCQRSGFTKCDLCCIPDMTKIRLFTMTIWRNYDLQHSLKIGGHTPRQERSLNIDIIAKMVNPADRLYQCFRYI